MDKLSFEDTRILIDLILRHPIKTARKELHLELLRRNYNEGQFYDGIVKHGQGMKFTSDQWYELLCRLTNRFLRSQLDIKNILSEEQISRLPPVTG